MPFVRQRTSFFQKEASHSHLTPSTVSSRNDNELSLPPLVERVCNTPRRSIEVPSPCLNVSYRPYLKRKKRRKRRKRRSRVDSTRLREVEDLIRPRPLTTMEEKELKALTNPAAFL